MTETENEAELSIDRPGTRGTGKKLTPAQYWMWRLTIEEMEHAKTKEKVFRQGLALQLKENENSQLKYGIKTFKLESVTAQTKAAKKEYDNFTASLETELGISLKGKIIDEITFEVKELVEGE